MAPKSPCSSSRHMIPADTVGIDHGSRTSTSRIRSRAALVQAGDEQTDERDERHGTRAKIRLVLIESAKSGSSMAFV